MLIYGHRGARGEAPENTPCGFQRAIDAGAPRVELDLRLSKDGHLVVIHDELVDRTTGASGRVADYTAAELAALDARHGAPPWPDPQPIPDIVALLEQFPSIEHFQLEAKPTRGKARRMMAERLATLFREQQIYQRATVTSFDKALLKAVRQLDPRIPLGLITDRMRPDPLRSARALGASLLVLSWKICSRERIAAAQAAGLSVSAWTVNDDAIVERLWRFGIDSIVTDFPSRMVPLARNLAAG